MKFFNSKICTKTVSLSDAVKNAPKMRSLDDILASNKAIKTAAAAPVAAPVEKTASVQVKIAEDKKNPFAKDDDDEKKDEKKNPFAKDDDDEKKDGDEKKDEKSDSKSGNGFLDFIKKKKEEAKEKKASSSKTVKLAMKSDLDFRQWEADKVIGAWKAAGSIDNCVANVKGLTNDPKMYCGLLQVAAKHADKMVKAAATAKKTPVVAKGSSPAFKRLAKLTEKERSSLYEYWKGQYGESYAKAMLENY